MWVKEKGFLMGCWIAVCLIGLVVTRAHGQGSRPVSGTSFDTSITKGHIKKYGYIEEDRSAHRVQFLSKDGKVRREIEKGGPKHRRIIVSPDEQAVVVWEDAEEEAQVPCQYMARVRFYDAEGQEQATANICGDTGHGYTYGFSGDGRKVIIGDVGEGDVGLDGEDGCIGSKGCAGIRVFTLRGKEVARITGATRALLSDNARYAAYQTRSGNHEKIWHWTDLNTGRAEIMPSPPCASYSWPRDKDGATGIPVVGGCPGYWYIPGKGLITNEEYRKTDK
jgi:hypothetical protein